MSSNISENKRVILIAGEGSKWFEQAIFIVRQNIGKNQIPMDCLAEAEKIINNYMTKPVGAPYKVYTDNYAIQRNAQSKTQQNKATNPSPTAPKKKTGRSDSFLNWMIVLTSLGILAALVVNMAG